MPRLEPLWALDPVLYLIWQRYPILRFGARSENVGKNYDPDFEEKREVAEEESKAYRDELEQLSTAELKARIADARKCEEEMVAAAKKRMEAERFYNQPESAADFKYWAKLSYWSLEEIVALSLGRNPKRVNWQSIGRFYSDSEFVRQYDQHRTIVNRAKAMGQLWEQTIPSVAVAWARRMRLEIPDQLAAEIDALGIQVADWKSLFDQQQEAFPKLSASLAEEREKYLRAMKENSKFQEEYSAKANGTIAGYQTLVESLKAKNKELSEALDRLQKDEANSGKREMGTRERESLLKLVIGMAMGGYGFNPTMARNSATADIETDLTTRGIPLDADTIRKYLNEAKALLPGDLPE